MKQNTAKLAIGILCAAVAVLAVLAGVFYGRATALRQQSRQSYQRAFGELVSNLSDLDSALEKSRYATSPAMASAICTEVYGKSMTAQMALEVLPFSTQELEQTAGFISRVGDYALCLSRETADGRALTGEETENLRALSGTAAGLAQQLRGLDTDLRDGVVQLERSSGLAKSGTADLGGSLEKYEAEFPEMPTLIYDGPFSQSKIDQRPKMLEELAEVDEAAARRSAAEFLGVKEAELETAGESEGDLPCYYFTLRRAAGDCQIQVSRRGGMVVQMLRSRQVAAPELRPQEGVERAREFLRERDYTDMTESYYIDQDGILTVNFAATVGEVICYPDLVKVSIALDNGEVLGFDAAGYLSAHYPRSEETPAISREEAEAALPDSLEQEQARLAIIPMDGEGERLCYEFLCRNESDRRYLLYVDAATGRQVKILILLEDENGTLTL